jgi:vanillate O-demethylase monooxygenase subunit
MSLIAKTEAVKVQLPRNCTFSESDWEILSTYWHPVAESDEIADSPVRVYLLDTPMVLFRTDAGISAAKDVCMHRGGQLSLGEVRDGKLVCGFHGFEYNGEGTCVGIPALAKGSPIPKKLRLRTYQSEERYGLIWVCLADEAKSGLPSWPQLEDGSGNVISSPSYVINASAGRRVENFNDIAHVPFLHKNSFGGPATDIAPYDVDVTEQTLSFKTNIVEQTRYVGSDAEGPTYQDAVYEYKLTLPFASSVKVFNAGTGHIYRVYDIVSPISSSKSKVFQMVLDESWEMSAQAVRAFTKQVNSEDSPQVEAQCPYDLPLDLRDEVHIPADRMSVEYRRALARLGLGAAAYR